jgi:hypothetical protein
MPNKRVDDIQTIRPGGLSQKALVKLLIALRDRAYGTAAFAGAGLAVGTDTTKVKTGGEVQYSIAGQLYTKAATDNFYTLTGSALGLTTARKYRLEIDSTGTASIVVGPTVAVASGTLNGEIPVPPRSDAKATLGILTVGGQVFTPGTTDATASATITYVNGDPDLDDLLAAS